MRNGGPLVLSLLAVMLWGTIDRCREAALRHETPDRFDIFEDEEEDE